VDVGVGLGVAEGVGVADGVGVDEGVGVTEGVGVGDGLGEGSGSTCVISMTFAPLIDVLGPTTGKPAPEIT
jgi:hypothetical protein